MTPAEVAAILRQFNEWRRSDYEPSEQPAPPDPREIGEAIDAAVEMIERLEAAEKSDAESLAMYRKARDERDELRTKIERMERQESVAKVRVHQTGGNAGVAWSVAPLNDFDALPLMRDGDKLYALPGAKGE